MIWDIALWLAVAVLVIVIVARLSSRTGRSGKDDTRRGGLPGGNPFTRGKSLPATAVVVLLLALAVKFGPGWLNPKPDWSEEQLEEVELFEEAITRYEQAMLTTRQGNLGPDDWESVRALLDAAEAAMSQVSNEVLRTIHSELPSHVQKEFLPGLRMGGYGMMGTMAISPKGVDPAKDLDKRAASDSLEVARDLLGKWNRWYGERQEEILDRLE